MAKSTLIRLIVTSVISFIIISGLVVGNVMCVLHAGEISSILSPDKVSITKDTEKLEEALAAGDEIVQQMGEEGTTLLKNQNKTLPLGASADNKVKVNLFMGNFYYTSSGSSGQATISDKKRVTLPAALTDCGFEINQVNINNKSASDFTSSDSEMQKAESYSDIAIAVIARVTMENAGAEELTKKTDDRMPVQISKTEEAMLNYLGDNYEKVIVLINSGNTMELGFAEDEGIDALLYVSWPGQSGTRGIARILAGSVNPSGKLTDTFVYDITKDPTWANNIKSGNQITYAENIYIGYRWYETADAEGYFDDVSNSYGTGYDGVVQFPFGYGLSYTTFDWELESTKWIVDDVSTEVADGAEFKNSKTTIEFSVKVTNTGDTPGKDVVQLYVTPPYTRGGIEKAHVTLAAFAKTDVLYPVDYEIPEDGDPEDYPTSQTVTLSFDLYDIASYDCYDANNNGVYGYELDPGDYVFKLMDNAHANDPTIQDYDITWKVPNMGTVSAPFGYTYRFDPDTKGYVTNRFTGDTSLYEPVDGSTGGNPVNYMTRENFAASFPTSRTPNRSGVAVDQSGWYNGYDSDADLPMLPLGQDNGLYLFTLESGNKASLNDLERSGNKIVPNEELIMQLGKDYDDELWDKVLAQLSIEEISRFIASAGFGTKALESVGKPKFVDKDGPAGFNGSVIGGGMDIWTGYACENLVGMSWNTDIAYEFGAALATEGQQTGVDGNYGVCVNLHRTSVNTRNFEAFSEDPLISGKMAARLLVGATTRGMYVYLKHLALSEPGQNPNNLNTWLTEQTLREIYLKSFEIAVKEGEANAVMSAFNRVGGVNANENYTLLTTVLRDEWKFEGCVITDYGMGDPKTFIRSGGDIKLNPNDGDAGLSASNKADVYCGVRAVKNVLYTYCNTYYRAKTFDPTRVVEITEIEKAFRWWILALVGLNVVIFGLITWQGIMIALRIRKDRKNMMTSNV